MATVVGTPTKKISIGMRMVPPPAPNRPANKPVATPATRGTNTEMPFIPETGKEM